MPILLILLVAIGALVVSSIRMVSQGHCYIMERLGRYNATWQAGLHLKFPIIDRITCKISLKEQVLDFPPQPVITKDNVTMMIDSVVYAQVFDPKLYTYGIEDPVAGLQNLTATTLRSIVGEMELDETLANRESINAQMLKILDEATDAWGIKVNRVEIKNINPPKEIEEVMTKQMRAERERRQTILEAQAHKEAVVNRAEGDKQAKIMDAEAERDAQIALAEGRARAIAVVYAAEAEGVAKLNEVGVSPAVLQLRSIEALKDVSDGQATKIFIPNNLSDTLASVGTLSDAWNSSHVVPKTMPREQVRRTAIDAATTAKVTNDPCLKPEVSAEAMKAAHTTAHNQVASRQVASRQLTRNTVK